MRKLFTLLLSLALVLPSLPAAGGRTACGTNSSEQLLKKRRERKNKTTASATPEEQITKGLLSVSRQGDDWFFHLPDSLLSRRLLATVRFTGTPAGCGKFAGEQISQQTLYFEKAPDGKILLRTELLINVADSAEAVSRAIEISNVNPIIASFKVESHKDGLSKIKVTSFLSADNPALGFDAGDRKTFALGSYCPAESYIQSVKTFPLNTEVRMVKTWNSAPQGNLTLAGRATGKVTFGLNISLLLLPEKPMMRRYFDPRVGYFTNRFTAYTDQQQRIRRKNFITRWRLEPKNDEDAQRMRRGELVEPKKPIIFYIDPATPPQWRPYLIQGVNDWQKAFEHAGFKNAIQGREWPADADSLGMSMEDARFSVIRYLASPIENAYGPHVSDPRTGEILESHICWYHNVMTLVHDWYMVQAGTLDQAAQRMHFDTDLMGQLIRFVSSHEVGHTLGLRHNFGSSSTVPVDSLRSKAWVEANGHTPSIMDYARFNYVAQPEDSITRAGLFPRIGDYDLWAIEWGYRPMPSAFDDESDYYELSKITTDRLAGHPRLWFGDGETNRTNDARCQTEDLGDDAVKASTYGLRNLQRELTNLPRWTYERNDIYSDNLSSMYRQILGQYRRYMGHVLANIGSTMADYKTVDQPGAVYTYLPAGRQRAALRFLDEWLLTPPTWLWSQPYMTRLYPNPEREVQNVGFQLVDQMLSPGLLDRLNPEYPTADYVPDVLRLLFREVPQHRRVSSWRAALQAAAVRRLIRYLSDAEIDKAPRATVLSQLRTLRTSLRGATVADTWTKDHYAQLADAIDRALTVK